ncbi:hypothetical protein PHJA_002166300, partial [Phtheirospermum japonicum]
VDSFLQKIFFETRASHGFPKNELNRFCITCEASICRHWVTNSGHKDHKVLPIYLHVYQNAVPISEMEIHIYYDNIQSYKCNKKWVGCLNPLPHNSSSILIEGHGAYCLWKRKLTDSDCF